MNKQAVISSLKNFFSEDRNRQRMYTSYSIALFFSTIAVVLGMIGNSIALYQSHRLMHAPIDKVIFWETLSSVAMMIFAYLMRKHYKNCKD
jgi:ABC-type spermidine/putrescine transport system permease subunit II